MKKPSMNKIRKKSRDFIAICAEHSLIINPYSSFYLLAELVISKGGKCPCVPDRLYCPCDKYLDDIKLEGRCKCGYFMSFEHYKYLLEKLNEKKTS